MRAPSPLPAAARSPSVATTRAVAVSPAHGAPTTSVATSSSAWPSTWVVIGCRKGSPRRYAISSSPGRRARDAGAAEGDLIPPSTTVTRVSALGNVSASWPCHGRTWPRCRAAGRPGPPRPGASRAPGPGGGPRGRAPRGRIIPSPPRAVDPEDPPEAVGDLAERGVGAGPPRGSAGAGSRAAGRALDRVEGARRRVGVAASRAARASRSARSAATAGRPGTGRRAAARP